MARITDTLVCQNSPSSLTQDRTSDPAFDTNRSNLTAPHRPVSIHITTCSSSRSPLFLRERRTGIEERVPVAPHLVIGGPPEGYRRRIVNVNLRKFPSGTDDRCSYSTPLFVSSSVSHLRRLLRLYRDALPCTLEPEYPGVRYRSIRQRLAASSMAGASEEGKRTS